MILYLDASALVKLYVTEHGSIETKAAVTSANLVGTSLISRAEVAAALGKAVRMGALRRTEGLSSLQMFRRAWNDLVRTPITETVVSRADLLAWKHHLRGYDAIHLAAASLWQETMGESVTLATFDVSLWQAAEQIGLVSFPTDLPRLLREWKTAKHGKR